MLGGLVSQDRGSAPNNISLSRGTAYQANQCRTQSGSASTASRSISAAVRTSSFGDGLACGGRSAIFYTGSPAYNIPAVTGGQHNVVASGGFVMKWGE